MASTRVVQILLAKGAPFDAARLEAMSDREGWAWIYQNFPPATKRAHANDQRPTVCFTGFTDVEKAELAELATRDFRVAKSVIVGLKYLVTGPNAGPAKLAAAKGYGSQILSEAQFLELLQSGALPGE